MKNQNVVTGKLPVGLCSIATIIFVACLISSCKTARLDREFIDVQNEVNRRLELPKDANSGFQVPKTVDGRISQLLKTENLSSEDLVIMGLLNNPTLQASFQNLRIVHAAFLSARSLNNPKVEIMARDSDEEDTDTNWEFTIVQDIMDLIFQPSRVKLSEIEMKRVKLGLAEESMDLALKIKKMVFSYQAEIAKMEILDKIYQARQAASELALNQHEAGNISDLELAFQQMAHQQIKLNLARQKIATESVRNQLNQLMGVWGEAYSWTLKTKLPELPKKEFDLDELGAKAISHNLNLSALNLENQSIRQRLSLARKGRITDLEVGFNTEKEPEGERLTGGIVEFGVPVFDRNQGEIAKFESLLRQNDRRIKAIAVEIRSQLSSLTFRQKKVREQVEYYKKSVMPLREKIVSLSQRHYNAMFIGTYELLQAKQSELSAQMDYINILRDFWLTHTDLKHLLAGGTIRSEETGHEPVVHPVGKDGKDDH